MNDPFYSPKQDRHLRLVPEEDLLLAKKRIAALEERVQTLNLLLEEISQISDQPFTETHEHLPAWIKTILQTRPAVAFREGVEAVDELRRRRKHEP